MANTSPPPNLSAVDDLVAALHAVVADAIDAHPQAELFGDIVNRISALPTASTVPVFDHSTTQDWLEATVARTTGPWTDLAQRLLTATPHLPWVRSYENLEPSPELDAFQSHYCFQFLAGPVFRGYEPPALADDLLLGFTLQEPNVSYPAHHHGPSEMYGVISGHLDWQVGSEWRTVGPGDVIVHRPHESHAMRTGDEPALTWVLWPNTFDSHVYMPSLDPADKAMEPTRYP